MSEQQQMPWFENHKSKNSLVFCRWLATQRKNYMVRRLGLLSSSLVLQDRRTKVIEKYQILDIFGKNEFPNGLSGGNMAKDPKDKTVLRVQCKPKLKVNCKNKKYNIQFAQKRSASMTVQMT